MQSRVLLAVLVLALTVSSAVEAAENRCAAVLSVKELSSTERQYIQSRCPESTDVWKTVDQWQATHQIVLPGQTIGPILRDYYAAEVNFSARLPEHRTAVFEAGVAALGEYLTNLVTKADLVPLSTIWGRRLGFGGFVFPRTNPYGTIRVSATPGTFDVYIDSEYLSSSIHEYSVPEGWHDVTVRKTTYSDCAQRVDVKARVRVDVDCIFRPGTRPHLSRGR